MESLILLPTDPPCIFSSPDSDDYRSYVHIRSLSDLRPYPGAAHATLDIPVDIEYFRPENIHVRYGLLGVFFGVDDVNYLEGEDRFEGTLVIWNYIEGILLGVSFRKIKIKT